MSRFKCLWQRFRESARRGARVNTVYHYRDYKARWFYLGYREAIRDQERAGFGYDGKIIKPGKQTAEEIQKSAERSLRAWVETGSFRR